MSTDKVREALAELLSLAEIATPLLPSSLSYKDGRWGMALTAAREALSAQPAPSEPAGTEDRRTAVWRVMQLADAMARRHAERDIPTGDLYRSIAHDAWVKAHQALHEAVEQLAAAPHPAAKGETT